MFLSYSSHQEVPTTGELEAVDKSNQGDVTERIKLPEALSTLPKSHTGIMGACGYKVCIKQGCHGRYPEGLLQARLPVKPMSFALEGEWPLLGEAPQGHRAIVCTRHHVLLVDQMDAVNGTLVAIEDKLRFLWDLPHTHGPVPAPAVTQHSRLKASNAATASWCPNSVST